jgi:hypothetical protein
MKSSNKVNLFKVNLIKIHKIRVDMIKCTLNLDYMLYY